MMITMEDLEILPLHRHLYFMKQCCDMINSEWPRSEAMRLHSLEKSCDTLPTSLVLVKNDSNNCKAVIGHLKITPIPYMPDSVFVETVVIENKHRGQGLGKYLMCQAEEYIKKLEVDTVYLSTVDKQEFYSKLGYVPCRPISIYGGYSNRPPPPPPPVNIVAARCPSGNDNNLPRKKYMNKRLTRTICP